MMPSITACPPTSSSSPRRRSCRSSRRTPPAPASSFPYNPGSLLSVLDLPVDGVSRLLVRATELEHEDPIDVQLAPHFRVAVQTSPPQHVLLSPPQVALALPQHAVPFAMHW